jgi:hypothetical protein
LEVEEPTDELVYVTIYQGILSTEPVMRELIWKQQKTLQGLMDKIEESINEEEAPKARAYYNIP